MKAVFIDIETTGLDFTVHVAIEVAVVCVDLIDKKELFSYSSCISCDAKDWNNADPSALNVNGFNPECIWNGKPIVEVRDDLISLFVYNGIVNGEAFFICQNPSFDRNFFTKILPQSFMTELSLPYHWLDLASMYLIKMIKQHSKDNVCILSKDNISNSLGIPSEERPHKAMNGVRHLMACYNALVKTEMINYE